MDDKLHAKIVAGIERTLGEVAQDPAHPLRRQFDDLLTDWIVQLKESPNAIARADAVKQQIFDHPTSHQLSASLWGEVKRMLDQRGRRRIERGARARSSAGSSPLAEAALEDEALLDKLDGWVVAPSSASCSSTGTRSGS